MKRLPGLVQSQAVLQNRQGVGDSLPLREANRFLLRGDGLSEAPCLRVGRGEAVKVLGVLPLGRAANALCKPNGFLPVSDFSAASTRAAIGPGRRN